MKKLFLLFAFFSVVTAAQFAKAQATFDKGDKAINIGVGLFAIGANASVEYGIQKNLGVGFYVGYERVSTGLIGAAVGVNYGYNKLNVGLRGAYHLNEALKMADDKFDLYVAGGVGVRLDNGYADSYNILTNDYNYRTRVLPQILARVGARYYFSEKTAGWAELGTGGSWFQGGIAFKF